LNITPKTGSLIAIKLVDDKAEDLMIITKNGITIRMAIQDIRDAGRNTQGVRLIRLMDGDAIAAVTKVAESEEEDEILEGEGSAEGDAVDTAE